MHQFDRDVLVTMVRSNCYSRPVTEKIRAFGTFATDKNERLLESYEDKAFEITELENCVPVPAMLSYTLFDQLDVLLDPISAR